MRAGSDCRPVVDLLQDTLRAERLGGGPSLGSDPSKVSSAMAFSVMVAPSAGSGTVVVDGVGDWVRGDLCGDPGICDVGGHLLTTLSTIIALVEENNDLSNEYWVMVSGVLRHLMRGQTFKRTSFVPPGTVTLPQQTGGGKK